MAWSEWQNVVGDAKLEFVELTAGKVDYVPLQYEEEIFILYARAVNTSGEGFVNVGSDVATVKREQLLLVDEGYLAYGVWKMTGKVGDLIYVNATPNSFYSIIARIGLSKE